jgi:hypothetical protein
MIGGDPQTHLGHPSGSARRGSRLRLVICAQDSGAGATNRVLGRRRSIARLTPTKVLNAVQIPACPARDGLLGAEGELASQPLRFPRDEIACFAEIVEVQWVCAAATYVLDGVRVAFNRSAKLRESAPATNHFGGRYEEPLEVLLRVDNGFYTLLGIVRESIEREVRRAIGAWSLCFR